MQTQTVFKAGNSNVVAIPRDIAEDLDIKTGQKVVVEKDGNDEAVIIKKAISKPLKSKKSAVGGEFKKWLEEVLVEDAGILDELANR